jgi:alpha-tubulin suppressor-like RCC1 family protein
MLWRRRGVCIPKRGGRQVLHATISLFVFAGCSDFDSLDRCTVEACDGGSDAAASCIADVKAGWTHACARKTDGTIWCWGNDNAAQLGPTSTYEPMSATPARVGGLESAVGLTAGDSFNCAVVDGGGAQCWGYDAYGNLGSGSTMTYIASPVTVAGLTTAQEVVGAGSSACAVERGGSVVCWGANDYGQLGNGSTKQEAAPVAVPSLSSVAEVALGFTHACALTTDGTVFCWGENTSGQLGDGTNTNRSTATIPAMISGVAHIAAGLHHTCAIKSGLVWCWGLNNLGQLGDGTTEDRAVPVQAIGIKDAVEVTAGGFDETGPVSHTCARGSGGNLWCWGSNVSGEIGDGTTSSKTSPTPVSHISNAISVAAGATLTCAVLSGGVVECWGANAFGQLGNGGYNASPLPVVSLLQCP